ILRKVKLVQGKVSEIETEDVTQHGKVASQLPVAGEKVGENTPVDLAVYVAPAQPSPNPKNEGGS
ncbi:MAG TPA: PASTA domain-containing protein, partial [Clostridia bacterium]|nr:PASTA domain-containing protein [Clostridia bacterium]